MIIREVCFGNAYRFVAIEAIRNSLSTSRHRRFDRSVAHRDLFVTSRNHQDLPTSGRIGDVDCMVLDFRMLGIIGLE